MRKGRNAKARIPPKDQALQGLGPPEAPERTCASRRSGGRTSDIHGIPGNSRCPRLRALPGTRGPAWERLGGLVSGGGGTPPRERCGSNPVCSSTTSRARRSRRIGTEVTWLRIIQSAPAVMNTNSFTPTYPNSFWAMPVGSMFFATDLGGLTISPKFSGIRVTRTGSEAWDLDTFRVQSEAPANKIGRVDRGQLRRLAALSSVPWIVASRPISPVGLRAQATTPERCLQSCSRYSPTCRGNSPSPPSGFEGFVRDPHSSYCHFATSLLPNAPQQGHPGGQSPNAK